MADEKNSTVTFLLGNLTFCVLLEHNKVQSSWYLQHPPYVLFHLPVYITKNNKRKTIFTEIIKYISL